MAFRILVVPTWLVLCSWTRRRRKFSIRSSCSWRNWSLWTGWLQFGRPAAAVGNLLVAWLNQKPIPLLDGVQEVQELVSALWNLQFVHVARVQELPGVATSQNDVHFTRSNCWEEQSYTVFIRRRWQLTHSLPRFWATLWGTVPGSRC